jgi:lysozyme
MKTSQAAQNRIAEHEGLRLEAYPDPGTGGEPWTIGVGHTGGVKPGDRITKDQAIDFLAADLQSAEKAVAGAVKVPLSQNEFDALVSFVFNVGAGAFRSSTLLKLLNVGDRRGAADQFLRWDKAGGRVMAGLTRRRADERKWFLT